MSSKSSDDDTLFDHCLDSLETMMTCILCLFSSGNDPKSIFHNSKNLSCNLVMLCNAELCHENTADKKYRTCFIGV